LFGCMYNNVSFPLEPKLYGGNKNKNKISIWYIIYHAQEGCITKKYCEHKIRQAKTHGWNLASNFNN
jgi:hypothetical protein